VIEKVISQTPIVAAALAVGCPECAAPDDVWCSCSVVGVQCGACKAEKAHCDRGKLCAGRLRRVGRA